MTTSAGTISLPLDPARPRSRAVATAASLARQLDLDIELVAVPGAVLADVASTYLDHIAGDLRDAELRATWEVLDEESAAGAILDHVAERPIDLVCLATRARHGPVHLVFGSVAETVMARGPVPVLVVGPNVEQTAPSHRRVVACLDGSVEAATALLVADRLRTRLDARLELVEVVRPASPFPPDVYESAPLRRAEDRLVRPADGYDVLHRSHPADAILEHLGGDPATVAVLGTRGRTGVTSVLLGSVARQVVAGARGPVLVVPPGAEPGAFLARSRLVAGA